MLLVVVVDAVLDIKKKVVVQHDVIVGIGHQELVMTNGECKHETSQPC